MSTPATPKAPQLVQDQISTINDMLLNAYSTVYKLAARIILHDKKQHEISTRQEVLLTKTLLNNLWSVLDCCSRLIFCWYHGKEPTVQEARERSIKFPCEFTQLSKHNRDPNQWEKKRLSLVLLARYNDIDQDTYKQLEGVFHTVQYKGSESPDKNTHNFYQLYYLLSHFTRNLLYIEEASTEYHNPEMLKDLYISPSTAVMVTVPANPCIEDSTLLNVPLLDTLYQSCEIVATIRDNVVQTLFKQSKFGESFRFELSWDKFKVQAERDGGRVITELPFELLHLECYGIEAELSQDKQNSAARKH